jgi:hypothetical protein
MPCIRHGCLALVLALAGCHHTNQVIHVEVVSVCHRVVVHYEQHDDKDYHQLYVE